MADVARLLVEIDPSGAVRGASVVERQTDRINRSSRRATRGVAGLSTSIGGLRASVGALTKSVGPLIAIFGAFATAREAIGTISDFEEQIARLQGISGATTDELQDLESIARELGASTRFSASQAAEGLEFLALAGFEVDQSVAALPATLNLATVGAISLGEAADFASNILGQFSLTANQTERVVDTLTSTSQSSNTSVEQLAQALSFSGTVAGSAGIEIEETAAAIGVLGDRGIQGARAGTNLRQVILQLLDPTAGARRELEALGISLSEIDPTTNNLVDVFNRFKDANLDLASATQIFNSRTAAAALTLTSSTDRIAELTEQNENAAGAAQEFSDTLNDTLKGSVLSLRSAIEELFLQAGDAGLLGVFRDIVDFSTLVVRALGGQQTGFQELDDTIDFLGATFEVTINTLIDGFNVVINDILPEVIRFVRDTATTFATNAREAASKVDEIFGGTFRAIGEFARDTFNTVIRLIRTAVNLASQNIQAIISSVKQAADAIEALADRDLTRVFASAAGAIATFTANAESLPERFRESFEENNEDLIGDAINFGRDYAQNFAEGFDVAFSGPEGFVSIIFDDFARRQAARVARTVAQEARQVSREEAAALAGSIEPQTGKVPDVSPSVTRETFVAQSDVLQSLDDEIKLVRLSNDARERAIQLAELQTEAEQAFGQELEENDPILRDFNEKLNQLRQTQELRAAVEDFRDLGVDAFADVALGARKLNDAIEDVLRSLVELALRRTLTASFDAVAFGGANSQSGGLFGVLAGSLFGGGRAAGGPTDPSRSFIVGERGPEIFRPLTGGFIEPNTNRPNQQTALTQQFVNINVATRDADSFGASEAQIFRRATTALRRGT